MLRSILSALPDRLFYLQMQTGRLFTFLFLPGERYNERVIINSQILDSRLRENDKYNVAGILRYRPTIYHSILIFRISIGVYPRKAGVGMAYNKDSYIIIILP